ncbi:MAG TPA: hypothetical protein VFA18_00110 [Gemmataceae bacterium]|nr:hypothetical protein [Gemmataceae bacterium]
MRRLFSPFINVGRWLLNTQPVRKPAEEALTYDEIRMVGILIALLLAAAAGLVWLIGWLA